MHAASDPSPPTLNRTTRRHHRSVLDHRFGDGFLSFSTRQLLLLGAAVGLLMGVASSDAGAAPFGQHAVRARSVRTLLKDSLGEDSSSWQSLHHHGPPTTTTTSTTIDPPTPTTTTTTIDPPTTTSTTIDPPTPTTTTTTLADPPQGSSYPVGTTDASEPSGMAPPTAGALAGYNQSYVQDFTGSSVPSGWDVFTGQPGGDPGAQWGASHVVVSGGLLQLNAFEDPSYGDEWVTGGLCQCGVAHTYGAYFVRSRVTGAGPTEVNLLWPKAPVWPPEIDFNETSGNTDETSATVHFSSSNQQDQRRLYNIDMTQWHTWGVIWSPTQIVYTVDGQVWGTVTVSSEIPDQAMTLDITQQTWCSSGWACPTQPESTQVDWVAEYLPQG